MTATSDASLLRACRRGNERAARLLHAQAAPAMFACARAILRDSALAEDAVQQAFCRILTVKVREVDRVVDPIAWLTMLARRNALMMLRSMRRRTAREERAAARAGASAQVTASQQAGRAESAEAVAAAIGALPRRLSEVLALKYIAGLTLEQIAQAIGANRNTVASRHRLAIERLKQELASDSNARDNLHSSEHEPCVIT